MLRNSQKLTARMLIMYVIAALLFLTSVELHIHTHEAAPAAEHGFAVSISSLASDFIPHLASEEINVGTDSVLKVEHNTVSFMAVFMLIAIVLSTMQRTFVGRLRENHVRLCCLPFRGLPPLRAPPL
jgi:hypothetical protein